MSDSKDKIPGWTGPDPAANIAFGLPPGIRLVQRVIRDVAWPAPVIDTDDAGRWWTSEDATAIARAEALPFVREFFERAAGLLQGQADLTRWSGSVLDASDERMQGIAEGIMIASRKLSDMFEQYRAELLGSIAASLYEIAESLSMFEREILEEACGDVKPRPWGAAVGAALESLRGHDLIERSGFAPTELGRRVNAYIRSHR